MTYTIKLLHGTKTKLALAIGDCGLDTDALAMQLRRDIMRTGLPSLLYAASGDKPKIESHGNFTFLHFKRKKNAESFARFISNRIAQGNGYLLAKGVIDHTSAPSITIS